ncbi:MAG TPA: FAD-dependent oxidoreductase [Myxococcota bacterium]|nr:FAD-dependent oxidoreductase [Myxococcota bacterium]
MRVAVVGAGAAGLTAAWLLDSTHAVTLFEEAPVLGGHVRTLGGNLPPLPGLEDVAVDCGVVEFEASVFTHFSQLLDRLDVTRTPVPCFTQLFLADGRILPSPGAQRVSGAGLRARLGSMLRLVPLAAARRRFVKLAERASNEELEELPIQAFLQPDAFGTWMRLLLTYAYSIPYELTDKVPAALAVPVLREFQSPESWFGVLGGVHRYVSALAGRLQGPVCRGQRVERLRRSDDGVELWADGHSQGFDAVVIATPPQAVLPMLEDPSAAEVRRFEAWRPHTARTVVHSDTGLYERRGATYRSEFDVFELPSGGGYNAWLNRLCGLPEAGPPALSLSLGMEDEIAPERVLHVQEHATPLYTMAALRSRPEVRKHNGERNTWFAGAWLGNGLHEGAVRSAEAVARGLGAPTLADR